MPEIKLYQLKTWILERDDWELEEIQAMIAQERLDRKAEDDATLEEIVRIDPL